MSEISRLSHIATKEASFPTKMFDPDTAMKPTAVRTIACSSLAITRRVSRRDMIQAAMVMVTDTELGVFMMCQVAIYRGYGYCFGRLQYSWWNRASGECSAGVGYRGEMFKNTRFYVCYMVHRGGLRFSARELSSETG